tara:strand:+ start:142 stop:897 length:756 start_codon:yes stop_codon:yes gene_type:complete
MIKKYIILSLIALVSCSPSEEKLKIKSDEIYNRAKVISSSEPCLKLELYKHYQKWESSTQTSFYSEIVSQEIKLYEELCSKKLIAVEDEKNRKAELRKLGSWMYGSAVNDFDERTGERYLYIRDNGDMQSIVVFMYLFNGELEQPRFSFYDRRYSEIKPLRFYDVINCRVKDNSDIFPIRLRQGKKRGEGKEYLFTIVNDSTDKDVQKLRNLIKEEGVAKFSCNDGFNTFDRTVVFNINFKYFSNALRKMN